VLCQWEFVLFGEKLGEHFISSFTSMDICTIPDCGYHELDDLRISQNMWHSLILRGKLLDSGLVSAVWNIVEYWIGELFDFETATALQITTSKSQVGVLRCNASL